MLAHMNQEDCGLGLKEIIGISETILLSWQDFPNAPGIKAYKWEQKTLFIFFFKYVFYSLNICNTFIHVFVHLLSK